MERSAVARREKPERGTVWAHLVPSAREHHTSPAVRDARPAVEAVLAGRGIPLGQGNFGAAFEVTLPSGERRIVKFGSRRTVHTHSPGDLYNWIRRKWDQQGRGLEAAREEMIHEAGVANEARRAGITVVPASVYVAYKGRPVIVREWGEIPARVTLEEYDDLATSLMEAIYAGWSPADDDLLVARRPNPAPGESPVFIADVGFWHRLRVVPSTGMPTESGKEQARDRLFRVLREYARTVPEWGGIPVPSRLEIAYLQGDLARVTRKAASLAGTPLGHFHQKFVTHAQGRLDRALSDRARATQTQGGTTEALPEDGWLPEARTAPPPHPTVTWAGFPWPTGVKLYHATPAMGSIQAQGFRTRAQGSRASAGGSHRYSVSFTLLHQRAVAIALGLDVLRRGALGELTIRSLINRLLTELPQYGLGGVAAGFGFSKNARVNEADTQESIDLYDAGHTLASWWDGSQYQYHWYPPGSEVPAVVGSQRVTRKTRNDVFFEVYTQTLRAADGKECFNPLFLGTDMERLSQVNPADLGVLTATLPEGFRVCGSGDTLSRLGYLTAEEAWAYASTFSCEEDVSATTRLRADLRAGRGRCGLAQTEQDLAYLESSQAERRASWYTPKVGSWKLDYTQGERVGSQVVTADQAEEEIRVYDPAQITVLQAEPLSTIRARYRLGNRLTFPPFSAETADIRVWPPPSHL